MAATKSDGPGAPAFFNSAHVRYRRDVERYDHRSVGPLRGMKANAWEGGHRMPFVARWPGAIEPGKVSDETICFIDMLVTFTATAGEPLPPEAGVDSNNILPALLGAKRDGPIREAIVHHPGANYRVIRQGPWKLIPALGSGGFSKPRTRKAKKGEPRGQLYNLENDLAETDNLWSHPPEIFDRLTKLLDSCKTRGRSTPVTR